MGDDNIQIRTKSVRDFYGNNWFFFKLLKSYLGGNGSPAAEGSRRFSRCAGRTLFARTPVNIKRSNDGSRVYNV